MALDLASRIKLADIFGELRTEQFQNVLREATAHGWYFSTLEYRKSNGVVEEARVYAEHPECGDTAEVSLRANFDWPVIRDLPGGNWRVRPAGSYQPPASAYRRVSRGGEHLWYDLDGAVAIHVEGATHGKPSVVYWAVRDMAHTAEEAKDFAAQLTEAAILADDLDQEFLHGNPWSNTGATGIPAEEETRALPSALANDALRELNLSIQGEYVKCGPFVVATTACAQDLAKWIRMREKGQVNEQKGGSNG